MRDLADRLAYLKQRLRTAYDGIGHSHGPHSSTSSTRRSRSAWCGGWLMRNCVMRRR